MRPVALPAYASELAIVASVSGGKDSTALMLALREAEIPFRAVFADTAWEAPETYAYLDVLRSKVGPIDVVGVAGGMPAKIRARAGFPTRLGRWCTQELKLAPLREYHDRVEAETGRETVSAVGVRAQESSRRALYAEWEDSAEWGGYVWRPLLAWTVEDVIAIHRRHGVPLNPLYLRGHDRVGCYPCIFSQKEEIRLIAEHAPERIDEIAALERECEALRVERNAEKPGRYAWAEATFFHGRIAHIAEVVAWSRTSRGGRQLPLLQPPPTGGCMR